MGRAKQLRAAAPNLPLILATISAREIAAPALAGAGVKTAWAGLYETTPDHQAILGPVPELDGFWCAAGFSGHGFMQAPAAALLLSQLLLDRTSEIDLAPFAFTRFAKGSLVKERNVI